MNDQQPKIRPGAGPDEQWRAALKQKMLAEAHTHNGPAVRANAGSRDHTDQPLDHVTTITDPWLGTTITACDLEPVSDEQALRVARLVAAMRDRDSLQARGEL